MYRATDLTNATVLVLASYTDGLPYILRRMQIKLQIILCMHTCFSIQQATMNECTQLCVIIWTMITSYSLAQIAQAPTHDAQSAYTVPTQIIG